MPDDYNMMRDEWNRIIDERRQRAINAVMDMEVETNASSYSGRGEVRLGEHLPLRGIERIVDAVAVALDAPKRMP